MNVCITKTVQHKEKGFQIMAKRKNALWHVFPGRLFTLEEAEAVCKENGLNVVCVGDMWHCFHN